jgi:polynucleotide 5'-kinase involved in rRNA processing
MLQVLAACGRLAQKAKEAGAEAVVMDTSGLVAPERGGIRLKLAKIDLLQPALVIALNRGGELEALLQALKVSRRTRVIELTPPPLTRQRGPSERTNHRRQAFSRYFQGSTLKHFSLPRLGVIPNRDLRPHRLLALEDRQGFLIGLGIMSSVDKQAREIRVQTPETDEALADVAMLHPGDVEIDPSDYSHDLIKP